MCQAVFRIANSHDSGLWAFASLSSIQLLAPHLCHDAAQIGRHQLQCHIREETTDVLSVRASEGHHYAPSLLSTEHPYLDAQQSVPYHALYSRGRFECHEESHTERDGSAMHDLPGIPRHKQEYTS